MSLSLESSRDDRRLARYLLGLLSDEETERLDESSIVDDDIAWRLRTIENALVDDYVRGALPADIVGPFEARYLSSSRRRAKVRFAERFVRTVDAAERTDPSAPAPSERWIPWRTFWSFRVTAAAAALVLIVGALVLRDVRWERARHDAGPGLIAPLRPASEPRRQVHEPRGTTTPPALPTPARSAIAVVLFPQTRSANTNSPGTTGSAGDAEPVIAVPRDADGLVLDLRLDVSDFSRYAASLMDLSGHRTVWRSARVAPTSTADRPAVSITVPASVLASQSYALELSGITASGDAEVVAVYIFKIARGR
jgi:hypothetical protein